VPHPAISICLPNLNTARYLPERFDSILAQTFTDWECVVSDNYSDDGAWQIIQNYAARHPRIKVEQARRDPQGMYPNWNNCLRRARGTFIYIATSDDTMAPECLAKLHDALGRYPDCGLAFCALQKIDEQGKAIPDDCSGWPPVGYFGPLMKQRHIRPAMHDSLIAAALGTPYLSMTQLLFRRSLLASTGLFEAQWGSAGDLAWQMRATLFASTVYIPEALATWRIHGEQASSGRVLQEAKRSGMFVAMTDEFLKFSREQGLPPPSGWPSRVRRYRVGEMIEAIWNFHGGKSSPRSLLDQMRHEPVGVAAFLLGKLYRRLGLRTSNHRLLAGDLRRAGVKGPFVV